MLLLNSTSTPTAYTVATDGQGRIVLKPETRKADIEAAKKLIEVSRIPDDDKLNRAMLALVKSTNPILRREACSHLSIVIAYAKNRQDYADDLIALLDCEDKDIRVAALSGLQHARAEKAIPQIIELTRATDPQVVEFASMALAQYDTTETVAALITLVQSSKVNLRKRAAIDLDNSRRPEAKMVLVALLDDPDPGVRELAPRRLTSWLRNGKGDDVIPKLISMLDDPEVKVQTEAASTLGESRKAIIVQPLLDVLARPSLDETLATRALQSLEMVIGGRDDQAKKIINRNLPLIIAALDHGNSLTASTAIGILAQSRTPEAVSALTAAAENHPRDETRKEALRMLEWMKDNK